jgi:hypothetical protein
MSQIFHPNMNIIARTGLLGAVLVLAGLAGLGYLLVESPYLTRVGLAQEQPVPFSHQQHAGELGLDCRYCHSSVEKANFAGIPSTQACMGCHAQVATEASSLEPVRASLANNQPLEWIRVHDLADFVYFNHGIHVTQGIGCESCHGRVDQMPVIAKTETLRMDWCLECHRAPERFIRPREAVFTMGWEPSPDQANLGPQLVAEYGIEVEQLDDCSICHR